MFINSIKRCLPPLLGATSLHFIFSHPEIVHFTLPYVHYTVGMDGEERERERESDNTGEKRDFEGKQWREHKSKSLSPASYRDDA
jgi:hypothetical protein